MGHLHLHRHGHGHDDGHAHPASGTSAHESGAARRRNQRRLAAALALAAAYMVTEAIGGWLTGSLALLADAGHMLSDVGALSLAIAAIWMAQRPADSRRTYGHARAEILAALAQGVALVVVAVMVAQEAFERLGSPSAVAAPGMIAIASGGLLVNLAGLWILGAGRHDSLNMRGAWLHVLSDALGSVGAIAAGVAIWARGWVWADPVASLAICALILVSAWQLVREAVDVLMETAPRHLDVDEIRNALEESTGIVEVHDLHVWVMGSSDVSLSSHVVAAEGADVALVLHDARNLLSARFRIEHVTLQVEPPGFASAEGGPAACAQTCDDPATAPAGESEVAPQPSP